MTLHTDHRLADAPMTAVRCERCAAEVLVRKSSWNQTSVQWDGAASACCLERTDAERLGAYAGRGLFLTCSALSASIIDAARHGDLPIVNGAPPATT
jgi:hypothetical protein